MQIAARNAILAGGGGSSEYWGMYFEAEAANVVVNMAKSGSPSAVSLEYSTDGTTWTAFDSEGGTTPITLAAIGDRVYFRAGSGGNTTFASSTSTYHKFTLSGAAGAHGNIMSLVDGGNPNNVTIPGAWCFAMLFRSCSTLTTPPELPATTLTSDCYHGMFWECRNLASAPALPAKTMQYACYDTMFYTCKALRSIEIAATTLADNCFSWMCNSSGVNSVKVNFSAWYGNNSTNSWLGSTPTTGTLYCPSALGTNETIQRGTNYCPTGWTVINQDWLLYFEAEEANVVVGLSTAGTPPAISLEVSPDATTWEAFTGSVTLANNGDKVFFRAGQGGNTRLASSASDYHYFTLSGQASAHNTIMSLLDGSNHVNTTITGTYAFAGLFKGCTNLTSAPNLPATTITNYCYSEMFSGCTSITTPPDLPANTMMQGCYMRMFQGCSALTSATGLNAQTLVQDCCTEMYKGCSSLTTVGVGAASIDNNGYAGLFDGCSSVNAISCGFDSWGASSAYLGDWVKGVANSGTFTCSATLGTSATIERGDNRCPVGWSVVNPAAYWGLNFEAEAANVVVGMSKSGTPDAVSLQYSRNNIVWFDFEPGTTTVTLANIGDKVWFRAGTGGNTQYSNQSSVFHYFTLSGAAGAHGNIMSLLNGSNQSNVTIQQSFCFNGLFYNCANLTSAPTLPATTLSSYCYRRLFYGCTHLTTPPALPATTAPQYCYADMFQNCTALTSAPTLPATSIGAYCYASMFYGGTSLTTAPALPATTLANNCYQYMFSGCTSLTTAPALPATTLARNCYANMFQSCTSLTTAPTLPATTMAYGCYSAMFSSCMSLTSAPALPAETLAPYCYSSMFEYCSALTSAPTLPATTLANNCYQTMFQRCPALTTPPTLPATTLAEACYYQMFKYSGLTNYPALPATTLAKNCYYGMFEYVQGISVGPTLPATTLAEGCYQWMFSQSRSLSSITVAFSDWNPSTATNVWLNVVNATGTFTCPAALGTNETIERGSNRCPSGWTVVNT